MSQQAETQRAQSSEGIQWLDRADRYGAISRLLHWSMALLLLWQFVMTLLFDFLGPSDTLRAVARFGPHSVVGAVVLVLVIIRCGWALFNLRRRPPYAPGRVGHMARVGHLLLYVLMFVIPAVALLRRYGSGKGWQAYGQQIIPATGEEVAWMVAMGDALHGLLAWGLLVLILGHVGVALCHRWFWRDGVFQRMLGTARPQR